MASLQAVPDLAEIVRDGDTATMRLHFHPGQLRAWESEKRFIAVISGTQGGKTVFGPHWLYREIQRQGPGDYLVVAPTFPLLSKKALPEFKRLFEARLGLGRVGGRSPVFVFGQDGERRTFGRTFDVPTQVFFMHATDSEALESATAKGAWLDEAGQKKFRLASLEAVLRRLSISQGRVLITTTPYDLGWLKQKFFDPWVAAKRNHPEIEVVQFDSTQNPVFPKEEFDRARRDLPGWKFDLFYRAIFTRPAGMIYDCFDEKVNSTPRFAIPGSWKRYIGLDFGGVNTAGVFLAEEPGTNKLFAYREYHAGSRTAAQHKDALLAGEPGLPTAACGGSASEDQWRNEFRSAGLPVREPPISDVEVGIDRVYGCLQRGELCVFDDLAGLLDEIGSYSREVDETGNPTEKIEDKASYHRLDALRYITAHLRGKKRELWVKT